MVRNKNTLFNVVLAVMYAITVPSLAALGESRLGVYISMFALEYFVAAAVLRPRRTTVDFVAAALLLAFSLAVTLRVLEVLSS